MGRLVLSKTQGEGFLRRVRAALGGGWERVAGVAGVQPRTILDWARGRWQISYEAALRLEAHSGVPVPAGATVLPEFWSTSKAATARNFRWNAVQVDMPEWIKADARLARACVRGLVDTDGCIYIHRHRGRQRQYRNIGLSFTSHSRPLVRAVHKVLSDLGLPAKWSGRRRVALYSRKAVAQYLQLIGTRNPKYHGRLVG